jgi:hypothetical protein
MQQVNQNHKNTSRKYQVSGYKNLKQIGKDKQAIFPKGK